VSGTPQIDLAARARYLLVGAAVDAAHGVGLRLWPKESDALEDLADRLRQWVADRFHDQNAYECTCEDHGGIERPGSNASAPN